MVFRDTMQPPNTAVWPVENGKCFYRDNAYHAIFIRCLADQDDYPDMTISVKARQISGNREDTYGLLFHRQAPRSFYIFYVGDNGLWSLY